MAGGVLGGLHDGQDEGEQDPQHRGTRRRPDHDGSGEAGAPNRKKRQAAMITGVVKLREKTCQ